MKMEPESTRSPRRKDLLPSAQELIKQLVIEDGLVPGDLLPTEAELVNRLGVGRSSVREGLRALEALGIVVPRQGVGIYLEDASLDGLTAGIQFWSQVHHRDGTGSLSAITQVRAALETQLVSSAAAAATAENLTRMLSALEEMEARAAEGMYSADADREFHRWLYQPLHNWILDSMIDAFWKLRASGARAEDAPKSSPTEVALVHRHIYDAVRASNPEAARTAMAKHFDIGGM